MFCQRLRTACRSAKALRLTAGAPSRAATYGLFCVFDGHNGVACAKHTHDSLIEVRSNSAGRTAYEALRVPPASSCACLEERSSQHV